MLSLATLKDYIMKDEELMAKMEALLAEHVLPELYSEQPLMRARACQTYYHYGETKFKNTDQI